MPEEELSPSAARPDGSTEISADLVAALGHKLDEFARTLTDDEQMTLATAFGLAARGFGTFCGTQACLGELGVGVARSTVSVVRRAGSSIPRLSQSLQDLFCSSGASRFSIEGLEVDRTMTGAKSVAAGAKSVAAAGAKSVAAGFCRYPALGGAKSVAAGLCRTPGFAGAKSVAAGASCRNPGFAGAKSVAAGQCRAPGLGGAKSVAAGLCRNPGFAGAKSVAAAACRSPWAFGARSFCR